MGARSCIKSNKNKAMIEYKQVDPTYYVRYDNNIPTAKFRLKKLPYCSAIVMLCNLEVFSEYRGKGLTRDIFNFVEKEAIRLKYTTVLCTDVESNIPMRRCLKKFGWRDVHKTVNTNTGNTVYLTIKNLNDMSKKHTAIFLIAFFSLVSVISFLILN